MLQHDDRAAAKAVNELMSQSHRIIPKLDREVQYFPIVHVFGHYDSRGGASLIIGGMPGASTMKAIRMYNRWSGWPLDTDAGFTDLQSGSDGPTELIVCDAPLPSAKDLKDSDRRMREFCATGGEGSITCSTPRSANELLLEYGGNYKAGWLDARRIYRLMKPTEWEHTAIVLWQGDAPIYPSPVPPPVSHSWVEYRLDTDCEFGEDAYGLWLIGYIAGRKERAYNKETRRR